ncbi:hypothetical protein [Desulfobotulus mexicanus]|uniref:hypothetical protein n=1 Tax=Desulfobotulus mexicanus TaxID=2586642 RepID=UPI0015D35295|nr:hypothetical protein [Desulfobotulus mexicanus]
MVVFSEKGNALIQCKTSMYSLEDAKMVLEPYNARPEYEARFHKEFPKLIFCTNALHVGNKVREKVKKYGIDIWTAKEMGRLLDISTVHYEDLLRWESAERLSLDS